MDYQILIEADYVANASESGYTKANTENFLEIVTKTEAGRKMLAAVLKDTLMEGDTHE